MSLAYRGSVRGFAAGMVVIIGATLLPLAVAEAGIQSTIRPADPASSLAVELPGDPQSTSRGTGLPTNQPKPDREPRMRPAPHGTSPADTCGVVLRTLSTGNPDTTDGALSVTVDGLGAFGSAVLNGPSRAYYNPTGSTGVASTVFSSNLYLDVIGYLLNDSCSNVESESATSVVTTSDLGSVGLRVTQSVAPVGSQGSVLRQSYQITNQTGAALDLAIVRHIDGDLYFAGDYTDDGGAGRADGSSLYEFEWSDDHAAPSTYVGISGDLDGNDIPDRWTIQPYPYWDDIEGAGGIPASDSGIIADDGDGDGVVDDPYDVTLSQQWQASILDGAAVTFTTVTRFGGAAFDTPDPDASTLAYWKGQPQPHYVPADGTAETKLVATVKNAQGDPLEGRLVTLQPGPGSSGLKGDQAWTRIQAVGEFTTGPDGTVIIPVTSSLPGPVAFQLLDVTSGSPVPLGNAVIVQFTRKVVVLAMGFKSYLAKRYLYWGDNRTDDPRVLDDPHTVLGALTALGYRYEGTNPGTTDSDAGATLVDMSWNDAHCRPADRDTAPFDCVATIRPNAAGTDVIWKPAPYDISSGVGLAAGFWKQVKVDGWAKRLAQTLITYDAQLYSTAHIHASFYLVGHSMGGEVVVRALRAILGDTALKAAFGGQHRGLLQTVVSVDGALNWEGAVKDFPSGSHCGSPVYTMPTATRERDNVAAVDAAHSALGTVTVSLTDATDFLVRPGVARLDLPIKPKPASYQASVYNGYGATKPIGDPNCAHSTLLRYQPSGLRLGASSRTPVPDDERFPLDLLVRTYVGGAVGTP